MKIPAPVAIALVIIAALVLGFSIYKSLGPRPSMEQTGPPTGPPREAYSQELKKASEQRQGTRP